MFFTVYRLNTSSTGWALHQLLEASFCLHARALQNMGRSSFTLDEEELPSN